MKWLRLWHDARTDAKLEALTDAQYRVWSKLLIFASEQDERGVIAGKSDVLLAVEVARGNVELLRETVAQLQALEIIEVSDGATRFINWDKRQRAGDDSAARKRDSRANHADDTPPDPPSSRDSAGMSRDIPATRPDIPTPDKEKESETDADADADADADDVLVQQAAPSLVRLVQSGEGYSEAFLAFWSAYPRKREKHSAATVFERNVAKLKVPAAEMIAAARNFGAHCEQRGTEAEFIPLPATFLGPKRKWKDWVRGVVDEGRSRGPQPKGWQSLKELRDLEGDDDQAAS
jgi:hypothetical protein